MRLRRTSMTLLLLAGLLAVLLPAGPAAAAAVTYVVNSTADDVDGGGCEASPGDCTLREAITAANAHAGPDKVNFALGAGVPTINVGTALPLITEKLNITGATGGASRVELTGPAGEDALNALEITGPNASGSIIRKLVINGFGFSEGGNGIAVDSANNNTITGNWIGTDETGMASGGPGMASGVFLYKSSNNLIGGATDGLRNVIADNFLGISVNGENAGGGNFIRGNYIGTNRLGTSALGNQIGIRIEESDDDDVRFNVVSGNALDGIRLEYGTTNAAVASNRIGLTAGPGPGSPLANGGAGVVVAEPLIGPTPTNANVIASNAIAHNGGLGIDLGDDGVTPNDNADNDDGPNGLQNFPVITRADTTGSETFIRGRIRTLPNTDVFVELFSNPTCDPSGFGEGLELNDSIILHTDAEGRATFADIFPHTPTGWFVTATATLNLSDSTSEFSACELVQ